MHLPSSYWVAIIGAISLLGNAWIIYRSNRKTDASADLRALVEALQDENESRKDEIGKLNRRLDEQVALRKQAENDRDECIGALARERRIVEMVQYAADSAISERDAAVSNLHEAQVQLNAAHEEIGALHNIIKRLDPEHPIQNLN